MGLLKPGDAYTMADGTTKIWNLPPPDPAIDKAILDIAESNLKFFIFEGCSFSEALDRINGKEYLSDNQINQLKQKLV